jgi:hypothetical protein
MRKAAPDLSKIGAFFSKRTMGVNSTSQGRGPSVHVQSMPGIAELRDDGIGFNSLCVPGA